MSNPKKIGAYDVVKSIGRGSFGIVTAVKNEQGEMYVCKITMTLIYRYISIFINCNKDINKDIFLFITYYEQFFILRNICDNLYFFLKICC